MFIRKKCTGIYTRISFIELNPCGFPYANRKHFPINLMLLNSIDITKCGDNKHNYFAINETFYHARLTRTIAEKNLNSLINVLAIYVSR